MRRAFLIALAAFLLLPSWATPQAASHSVEFDDPAGDARSGPGGLVPAAGGEIARVVDVQKVSVGEETGFDFQVALQLAALNPGPGYYLINGATYVVCFQWSGAEGWFRATLRLNYRYLPATNVQPRIDHLPAVLDYMATECTTGTPPSWRGPPLEATAVDETGARVVLPVPRAALAETARQAENLERLAPPKGGDELKNFFVEASADYNRQVVVSDRAPDTGGAPQSFAFALDTFNTELVLAVETNVRDTGERVSQFAINAGGFQAVPVHIQNFDPAPHAVLLNATVEQAAKPSSWSARIVPRLLVPAARGNDPGERTATLIVEAQEGVAHKEAATVAVVGAFEDRARTQGQALVEVIATVSPGPGARTLYLHSMQTPRGTETTMNTLRDDPAAADFDLSFSGNAGGVETPTVSRQGRTFPMDVPPVDDLVVDATRPIVANLTFSSSPPIEALLRVFLLNGEVELAQGSATVTLPNEPAPLALEFFAKPPTRTASVVVWRFEPGQEFRLRVEIEPKPRQANPLLGSSETGEARLVVKESDLFLPILATTKRVGVNLTESGALVSLAMGALDTPYINPGTSRVFNLTVQNEGVRRDTVALSLRVDTTRGYRVAVDRASFTLQPGEGSDFRLLVAAPATAPEDDRFEVTVLATSRNDPRAQASATLSLVATQGVEVEGAAVDFGQFQGDAPRGKDQGIPAPGAALLAFVLLLAALARRRWDE